MAVRGARVDRPLIALIAILIVGGGFIFGSAAFGLLARGATHISSVVFSHVVLGIGLGLVALFLCASIDYKVWRRFAPHVFILALIATALVFIPHLGAVHGGGRRWIILFGASFQPAEALKIASVIAAAAYFSSLKAHIHSLYWGVGGFFAVVGPSAILLILQPDIGTLGVICISVFAVYIAAGARMRDIALICVVAVLALGALAFTKPYVRDRITTFFHPAQGQLAESFQIRQSLIAIGSGSLWGRGLGQGVQKFTYLPEPMGDSIFAVAGEEVGFMGSLALVGIFLAFALRGFAIATRAPDLFGGLLATGISTYLASEAFINIAAMLGLAPLTGIPLTFISQGGSAMLVSLASAGILLSISRHQSVK